MNNKLETQREQFYRELSERVKYIKDKLQVTKGDEFILGGPEALIINCTRRKTLVPKVLTQYSDLSNLEFFVNKNLFSNYGVTHVNKSFCTHVFLDTAKGYNLKINLINHVPPYFRGTDFRYATGEFLLSDEELLLRGEEGDLPYGLTDDIINEMKFSLGITSRLTTQENADKNEVIPKDYLDGDYPTVVLRSILGVMEETIKAIYLRFLKMVLDKSISLSVLEAFINRNNMKEGLVERILVIRYLNLIDRMNEVLNEHQLILE